MHANSHFFLFLLSFQEMNDRLDNLFEKMSVMESRKCACSADPTPSELPLVFDGQLDEMDKTFLDHSVKSSI